MTIGDTVSKIDPSKDDLRILVVGGRSNAAQVFRRRVARKPGIAVTLLAREPIETYPGEHLVVVTDYFSPPQAALKQTDVVINFAGRVHGSTADLFAANAEGPRRLARAAQEAGVRRFIHLSSLSVYGYAEEIGLQSPEAPVSPYGRSKQAGDIALLETAGEGFSVTLLRVPIIYSRHAGKKLHQLASAMLRLGWFPAPSRIACRSVLHLDNLAIVLEMLLQKECWGIQFASDPEPFTIETLAEVLSARTGRPIAMIRLPTPIFGCLRVVNRGLYSSLFAPSVIRLGDCVEPGSLEYIPLRKALEDLIYV